ncbi:MAG: ribose 5-phosphate isomerase B [Bryobacteraceae bacterium]|nr:ribose 5-phosphate isomerase B [Bryobacteraceae bacterium]
MKIAIGADHAGFALKECLRDALRASGYEVVDFGTHTADSTDYPDYAEAVASDVASGHSERGILVCSTGVGMSIAANKVPGIRAALAFNREGVRLVRSHNNANVLAIGAKFTDEAAARELVEVFLNTEFEGGRHARRLAKIAEIEKRNQGGERAHVTGMDVEAVKRG